MARQPAACQKLKRTAQESKTPPVDEWEPLCCVRVGHFWVDQDDIEKIVETFVPRVGLLELC